ncbi:MAG: RNA 2',3'-cyclic phosphodiesterase [Gaiellales bacterium]|nr:MAG: RNA 2',3'-cyclic phosphodiesterase [Gaiellales bacterium]
MTTGDKNRKQARRPQGYEENHSYRLFVAVDIPPEAVEGLVSWQQEHLSAEAALRMTPAAQLHVTLAFIGQAGERERGLAVGLMEQLAPRRSFEVTLAALVGLPKGRSPRVVAARVDETSGALASLHDEVTSGLAARGIYRKEKRPWFPHVTIARARGRAGLDLAAIEPEPVQFTAVRTTLYNSILKAGGALHKALKTVQLT